MSIQVHVKDLPEHGVTIIASSDPTFDQRASTFLKGQPQKIVERIKPFSVIVENTSGLAIVGSCLKWEILKTDGTVFRQPIGSANPRALMDGEPRSIQTSEGAAIPQGSTRFVSLLGSATQGQQVDLNNSWLSFRGSQSEMEAFTNALLQGDREEAFNKSLIGRVMREATSITVSIDVIFFEDGTFVGDDKNSFFDNVKAQIDAEYDLVTEISNAQKQRKSTDEIFKDVTDFLVAHTRTRSESQLASRDPRKTIPESQALTSLASVQFSSDPYQNYKTLYAQQLMMMKEALGAKQAIREAFKLLERPRIELKRK